MTIYIDLDDTVADFRKKAEELLGRKLGKNCRDIQDFEWDILNDQPNFFADLEVKPNAKAIIKAVKVNFPESRIYFLSAIPAKMPKDICIHGKKCWVSKHFPDITPHFVYSSKDKITFCRTGDILIDDKYDILVSWNDVGGIGIHYEDHIDVVQIIKSLGRNK